MKTKYGKKCRVKNCYAVDLICKGMCYPHYNKTRRLLKIKKKDWTSVSTVKGLTDLLNQNNKTISKPGCSKTSCDSFSSFSKGILDAVAVIDDAVDAAVDTINTALGKIEYLVRGLK